MLLFCFLAIASAGDTTCDSSAQSFNDTAQKWARSRFPVRHDISLLPIAPQLPRIHVNDLDAPENEAYRDRRRPFILTGAMENWGALKKWPMKMKKNKENRQKTYLTNLFRYSVVDFYPFNMLEPGTHPHLARFRAGVHEMLNPPGRYHPKGTDVWACREGCRYLHLQLTPDMWSSLETVGDIPLNRHEHLEGDQWWMNQCLPGEVREEYHLKTHWKIILVGTRGSGMFNHSDSLMSSSWHAHVQGRKWWYVCGNFLGPSHLGGERGPFACYESVLEPGEVLFYGRGWHHHTRNLDTPTMTLTGTVVTHNNFMALADRLYGECARADMSFDFSGQLCDALDSCYPLWHQHFTNRSSERWRPWRQVASASLISRRDARKPSENNYDGRNFIAEESE